MVTGFLGEFRRRITSYAHPQIIPTFIVPSTIDRREISLPLKTKVILDVIDSKLYEFIWNSDNTLSSLVGIFPLLKKYVKHPQSALNMFKLINFSFIVLRELYFI